MLVQRLFAWLLFRFALRAQGDACPNVALEGSSEVALLPSGASFAIRQPRASCTLADVIGLDDAKAVLKEAIVIPSAAAADVAKLFGRSDERSAVLLVGPFGLGKRSAVEAAAAAAGAQVASLRALDIVGSAASGFCSRAMSAVSGPGRPPLVVIIESLETAPAASLTIRQCLREAARGDNASARLSIVATMERDVRFLSASALLPFGYVTQLGLPTDAERKQFLLRLLAQISRVDPQWASTLREAAVSTLASLTAQYTFAEIDLILRRAFLRSSTNDEGIRDPVALHHFEKIIADTQPYAAEAFNESQISLAETASSVASTLTVENMPSGEAPPKPAGGDAGKKKPKDVKDPMDGIFGWCNFWLPEALHLPPVVWAMIIFGILAHFMARSTYQPYGNRKRRQGPRGRSSLFGDMGGGTDANGAARSSLFGDLGAGAGYPSFGDHLNDWYPGGSNPFANFPPPPGVPRPGDVGGGTMGTSSAQTPSAGSHAEGQPQPKSQPQAHSPPTPESEAKAE